MRRISFPLFLVVVLPFFPRIASGELIQGTARLYYGYEDCDQAIDFSTQSLVGCHTPQADFAYVSAQEKYFLAAFGVYPGESMYVVDTPFEDVDLAPPSGDLHTLVQLNRTYIIKTRDPLYAKLVVRSINEGLTVDVEYVVQTDGSNVLGPSLAVESTTWGKVKALYR